MSEILPPTTVPSAETLIREALAGSGREERHEFWLFSGPDERLKLERKLAADGFDVRLHSAFKPLVSMFLAYRSASPEGTTRPAAIMVACPVHPDLPEGRFRLEAYPLARLVRHWWPGASLTFTEYAATGTEQFRYHVTVQSEVGTEGFGVFAPNRVVTVAGRTAITPCGWWRSMAHDGTVLRDAPFETPYELLFSTALDAVSAAGWTGTGPHFGRLRIDISHDGTEIRLPVAHDRLDTAEALHEDLYFSLLELFSLAADLPAGSRELQPGQIAPFVRNVPGGPNTIEISSESGAAAAEGAAGTILDRAGTARLSEPPSAEDLITTFLSLPGERLEAQTRQGRTVHGLWRPGRNRAVLVIGGQHANENSGMLGALRAARELLQNPENSVGAIVLENPDGFALHRELCQVHREHMHHAARYTAFGDDVSARSDAAPFEKAVRQHLLEVSGAELFINLHGYPAHEWIRPLSGYLPRGFEWWALPQGFILMARHREGYGAFAERLLRQAARDLQRELPELEAFNREMLGSYEAHTGRLLFPLEGHIPLALSETDRPGPAIEVITEYPDETVHGDDFQLAQETQFRTVMSITRQWWLP